MLFCVCVFRAPSTFFMAGLCEVSNIYCLIHTHSVFFFSFFFFSVFGSFFVFCASFFGICTAVAADRRRRKNSEGDASSAGTSQRAPLGSPSLPAFVAGSSGGGLSSQGSSLAGLAEGRASVSAGGGWRNQAKIRKAMVLAVHKKAQQDSEGGTETGNGAHRKVGSSGGKMPAGARAGVGPSAAGFVGSEAESTREKAHQGRHNDSSSGGEHHDRDMARASSSRGSGGARHGSVGSVGHAQAQARGEGNKRRGSGNRIALEGPEVYLSGPDPGG